MRAISSLLLILLLPAAALAQSYLPTYDSPIDAIQSCPGDSVVWLSSVNAQQRYKGQPKTSATGAGGGYICRQQAINAGYGGLVTHLTPLTKH